MTSRLARSMGALALGLACLGVIDEAQARQIYCCDTAEGKRLCADKLPQACYGRAYRIVGADGTVLEHVAAPMTREQRQEADRIKRRKELEEARHRSQRLQDRALMDTYQNIDDIDVREQRAVDDFKTDLDKARVRMEELKADAVRLKEEAKLYAEGDVPTDLREAINDNQSEQSAQLTVIEAKEKSIEAVRARFARDRERYRMLTDGVDAPRR